MSRDEKYEEDLYVDESYEDERAPSFIGGAWLNRRWTRSSSSVLLGLFPAGLLIMSGGKLPVVGPALYDAGLLEEATEPYVIVAVIILAVANVLLFPFAREMYFRATGPLREGMSGSYAFGLMFLVVTVCRIAMMFAIWCLSIPLGLFGMSALGEEDRRGLGWRIN